jgi:hypothetical protein
MKKTYLFIILAAFIFAAQPLIAQETSVGGYGELHFNDPEGSSPGELDFHRFVIYFGHSFNDWISFHSEVEIEHVYFSSDNGTGELGLEQALLEFHPWEHYGFRAGIALIPAGIINETHEPPTFHGVERPNFNKIIIPTTWREAGIGFFGQPHEMIKFQLYYTSALDANGFSLKNGLRGGREHGARPKTSDMALSGRIDILPASGLIVGLSGYAGSSTRGNEEAGDGNVTLFAGDVRYSIGNLQLRAEGAVISVGDVEMLNTTLGTDVAEQMNGFYGEAAYNFLGHIAPDTDQKLFAFARYEVFNTEATVVGFEADGRYDRTNMTFGFTYLPDYDVVVKVDWQVFDNALDGSESTGQFNAGVGYAFH